MSSRSHTSSIWPAGSSSSSLSKLATEDMSSSSSLSAPASSAASFVAYFCTYSVDASAPPSCTPVNARGTHP